MTTSDVGGAADNIFRQFCRYLGIAYVLSFVVFFGALVHSTDVVPIWWTIGAALAIHGVAAVMVAVSFHRPGVSRVLWSGRALAVGYALAVATWPLVWNGDLIDANYGMWFTQFNGFAAATAAVVWRVRWSLPYLVYAVVSVQFVNAAVHTPAYASPVLTDTAWSFCLCAMPYAIAVAALRSGRVLDATRAQSAQAAADAAATVARAEERARFDALTHDRVMSTLLTAARHPMSDDLVAQAAGTLSKLDVLGDAGELDEPEMDAATAIRMIRGSVADIDTSIEVSVTVAENSAPIRYPGNVIAAIADATGEATRNSMQHSGPAATTTVEVSAGRGHLRVHIIDDGVGFDPDAVRPDRLGVSGSIRDRMELLAGGSAVVVSAPGKGTTVSLKWSRP